MSSVFYLLILLNPLTGEPAELNDVRRKFHQAVLDEDKIEEFHLFISGYDGDQPLILAYQASAQALLCQQSWNPIEKFNQLRKYEEMIDQAVQKSPDNLEIRFLRFSTQYYIPKLLGFSDSMEEDKVFIIQNIDKIRELGLDPYFSRYILYFVKESGLCSPENIRQIETKLSMR